MTAEHQASLPSSQYDTSHEQLDGITSLGLREMKLWGVQILEASLSLASNHHRIKRSHDNTCLDMPSEHGVL